MWTNLKKAILAQKGWPLALFLTTSVLSRSGPLVACVYLYNIYMQTNESEPRLKNQLFDIGRANDEVYLVNGGLKIILSFGTISNN